MALTKHKVPISFAKGIDTKTDEKQVLATDLLELENGVFTKNLAINKRNGYDVLSKSLLGSTIEDIASGAGLSRYKNELNLFDGTRIYAYLDTQDKWSEKGTIISVDTKSSPIIKNTFEQTRGSYAFNDGLELYVWQDSKGDIRSTLVDSSSGTYLFSDTQVVASATKPKCYALGNRFIVLYERSNGIRFKTINVFDPSSFSSEDTITSQLDISDPRWDALDFGNRIYTAFAKDAVAEPSLVFVNEQLQVSDIKTEATEDASGAIAVIEGDSFQPWVVFSDGTDVNAYKYDANLTTKTVAVHSIEASLPTAVRNITGANTSGTSITVLYEITKTIGSVNANYIRQNTTDDGAVSGTPSDFIRSVGLYSKAFSNGSSNLVVTVHESDLQSSYFIYNLNGDLVSKVNNQTAGGYTKDDSFLTDVQESTTGMFKFAALKKGLLTSVDNDLYTILGLNSASLDFTSVSNYNTDEIADNLLIVGGTLQMYDGNSIVEHGFNVFPEDVAVADFGSGSFAGTFSYSVVYVWTDNQGQLHKSAPSIPVQIVASGSGDSIDVTVPTLRITNKEDAFIEIYRTENNGTIFYKVTDTLSPTLNNKTVDTIVFNDDEVDADLIDNEILYITGGVLDNIAAPTCSIITTFKNRAFLAGLEDPNQIQFSKIVFPGFPAEFNDTLTIDIDSLGGGVTALGVLDDKLVIFKESAIFILTGEGPNNLGLQNDFIDPQIIASDVGCRDANSVVITPAGIMFKSSKGIYLLDRGLQVSYIGDRVEKFNDDIVTSSSVVPTTNEVRFVTGSSQCLVFNYLYNQWSTFTNHESVGTSVYENKFCFVKSDGRVFQENPDKFTDGDDYVKLKIVTSWIQLAGLQGFQRIYKFLLLGDYKSAHKLVVKVGYDFSPVFVQEVVIDATSIHDPAAYGDDATYGDSEVYGGTWKPYQFRIFTQRQKCQAFRVSIEDSQSSNFGEGFSLSTMTAEIGVKATVNKVDSESSFGVS